MKPFTSKHCTPISYGSPAKHMSQKYGKDNEGHYHYKDKEGKPLAKFSTTPLNQEDDKKKKEKPLTRAEINKKYQGKLDTKKGPKGPGHSGRFNELIGKKVTSGDKGDSPLAKFSTTPLNKGEKVTVTTESGKKVEVDSRSPEAAHARRYGGGRQDSKLD